MEKRYDVLTFGDLCVDLIVSGGDVVPEFGQKEKMVEDYSLEMGGSCGIFACQAAKLGLATRIVGRLGADSFGDLVRSTLEEAGVDTRYVKTDSRLKTGITVALNKGDDRAMLTYNGSIDAVGIEDVGNDMLRWVRHLHIGSYFLMKKIQPHYPAIVRKLKEYGATTSLDTNWDPEENWDGGIWQILPYIDILLPNENELLAIAKERCVEKAVAKLTKIVPILVVKKGKDGADAYTLSKVYTAPAMDVPVKDTVGAGDSFDGGFLYGYLTGRSIEECLRMGCICGSLNTKASGGTRGQPRLGELHGYLKG
ncbi:MAG: carbohydrate kinase family protein [Clostridia bacterium]|jgi:sugar/nucleoside kinase (ribokinase family)